MDNRFGSANGVDCGCRVGSVRRRLARRSLKPQLNQIRTWVRQGRTDAWIAHQLDVSVGDIRSFKREHELAPADAPDGDPPGTEADVPDLRAEDDALVAEALEAERQAEEEAGEEEAGDEDTADTEDGDEKPRRRRRGRRGGRGRTRTRKPKALEGTFDHGEEGYGLWLDPAVQDNAVYAEHWAGQREVNVRIEADQIVIRRPGGDGGGESDDSDE
jgi:hypothetical protein